MPETMFFGTLYPKAGPGNSSTTVNAKMSFVPVPDSGMDASAVGYQDRIDYENGGADIVTSAASHREYQMEWSTREGAAFNGGLDIISAYADGEWGDGLIYFADRYNFDTNLLTPNWATPGLVERGWKNIYDTTPTFSNTASNIYDQPLRSATWTTNNSTGYPVDRRRVMVLPIQPDHTLWIGFSGSSTGNSSVQIRPVQTDGSYGLTRNMTLLSPTGATRMNDSYPGGTFKAIEVFISQSVNGAGTITLTSGLAQQWRTGITPTLTGSHIRGQGNSGCRFETAAPVENYVQVVQGQRRHLKGMSANLIEVGQWARLI